MTERAAGLDDSSRAMDRGVQERRFWADLIDVVVTPAVLGAGLGAVLEVPVGVFGLGGLLAMPLLVAAEAIRQRTPGMALLDLQVEHVHGGAIGWRSALPRRMWMAVYGLHLVPPIPTEIAELVVFAAMVLVVVSMHRHPGSRGWHGHIADTRVVRAVRPRPRPSTVATWTTGCAALLVVGWWFSSPATTSSGFDAFDQADELRCEVVHDGWVYARNNASSSSNPVTGSQAGSDPTTSSCGS